MERALQNYIEELRSDIASLVYSEGEGASFEDKFTEYCIEVFESIGKSEGARVLSYIHPNSQGGIDWKINGYCLKDMFKDENNKTYFETLDLFITYFRNDSYTYNITQNDYTKTLNQVKKFINGSLKRHIDYIDNSNTELIELIKIIGKQGVDFDRINVYFLMNGFSNHEKEKIDINDVDVFVHTWDISRLFKINESNSNHEPIEIEFEKLSENGRGLQCIQVPPIDELYDCYLAIVPGEVLANLYKEFSNELLESNVRAFLGQAGKFNKGIRDTIRTKPQMFLPYNNGITATAESVDTQIIENQLTITKLNDFQIVNGGQTTASLYHTQKKFKDADLSKIFVQMKLTVIKDKEKKNSEVPNIARFANSQNKVSELDLSSNNPYFVQIETLSRKKYVIDPNNKNLSTIWYFERVNGQYKESLNKLTTPAQQRKFKEQNPTNQKYVKSDVAKFINLWELEPHFVSQGAQKNFIHYTKKINELVKKNKLPGDNFYKKLIANAILFKCVDKLFGRKNVDAIGDTNLKSFSVAYTLSYFHYLTENRIDLWKIYEDQIVPNEIEITLKKLLVIVYNHLVDSSNNTLLSEYAKRESSWKHLKEQTISFDLSQISDFLIPADEVNERDKEIETIKNDSEDSIFQVSKIVSLGNVFWNGLYIYSDSNEELKNYSVDILEIYGKIKNSKNLNNSNISFGKRILDMIDNNVISVDYVKGLSSQQEVEIIDYKEVFDRLKRIDKNKWKSIIELGEKTNLFENNELFNIKSVSNSILKNERVREVNLIQCFKSLGKVKRFGIEI